MKHLPFYILILLFFSCDVVSPDDNNNGAADYTFYKSFGTLGTSNGNFKYPQKLYIDNVDRVHVLDTTTRLQIFNNEGVYESQNEVYTYVASGNTYKLTGWGALTKDKNNNTYVAENYLGRIKKITPTGQASIFAKLPEVSGKNFPNCNAIAIDSKSYIYVMDYNNSIIYKYNMSGALVKQLPGQFGFTMAIDKNDHIILSAGTSNGFNVTKIDTLGNVIKQFGPNGFQGADGTINEARGIAVDGSNNIYVADLGNGRVQKFSSEGVFIAKFGSKGAGTGQFVRIEGVAVDSRGYVYATDSEQNKVNIYKPK